MVSLKTDEGLMDEAEEIRTIWRGWWFLLRHALKTKHDMMYKSCAVSVFYSKILHAALQLYKMAIFGFGAMKLHQTCLSFMLFFDVSIIHNACIHTIFIFFYDQHHNSVSNWNILLYVEAFMNGCNLQRYLIHLCEFLFSYLSFFLSFMSYVCAYHILFKWYLH